MRDHAMKTHSKIVLSAGLGLAALAGLIGAALAHGDGRGDFSGHPMMQRMMQEADANGDGAVTRDEMQAFHQSQFGAFDADGNGAVTWEEMRAGMRDRMFSLLDADGDGQISRAEFDAMHRGPDGRGSRMMGGGHMMGSGSMMNGGHMMSDDEMHHRRGYGMMRFDENEDGAIDRDEAARMTERMFDHMDSDGDGRIPLNDAN